ncbi:hypothetical protein [Aquisalibacillus elongatus]|uniref:Uncharacterized protein n=1 Tax=Aquisalibacillus elongatus TaxID=485577 RepID=A0A3N5BG66_9BACI|nr:hypothetical protein [Aquisalibacillus elongatus]RPF54260.1 hypothetical protein EDC24_1455 [Aquisalibacillus elongatus]
MKRIYIRPIAALLMGFTYLIAQFIEHPVLPTLISLFATITIISFIPYLSKTPMILISGLLILSAALFLMGEGLTEMFRGVRENVGLLAIFIFVPLISLPIRNGQYLDYMDIIFNYYIKTSRQLYAYLKVSLMGIGSVMNLGTIPIMYHLTSTPSFKDYEDTRLRALIRGFAMSFLWSPYFISIALILSYFDVTWFELFPYGFTFALIGILLGFLMMGKVNEQIDIVEKDHDVSIQKAKRKLVELVLIIVVMTALTMTIEHYVDLSVLTIIPIIAIVASTIWSLFFQSPGEYVKDLYDYTQNRLPKMGNELSLFIAAGTFGLAILNAGASEWIIYFIESTGITHMLILLPILALIVNGLSFVGIHPIITNTALAITLSSSPIFEGDHLLLSLGLLIGWMMTILVSPFSATNLMVGNLTNTNSVHVGLKMNWKYALILYALLYAIIAGLYFIGV